MMKCKTEYIERDKLSEYQKRDGKDIIIWSLLALTGAGLRNATKKDKKYAGKIKIEYVTWEKRGMIE